MSLETITLISILTLLAVCLGVSVFWIVVIETANQHISKPTFLELIAHIRLQTARFMSVVFFITFTCGVILNIIPHSRAEPYLLNIGLISLTLYLVLVLIKFIFIDKAEIATISQEHKSKVIANKLLTIPNILLGFHLLSLTVAYWSFLHYALNPKL
ncbi:MAG: hypothetical protein AAGE96_02150 [Cyanobacteria bacterium P01_G01_bin.19]